jgi:hypothetical protein
MRHERESGGFENVSFFLVRDIKKKMVPVFFWIMHFLRRPL